MRRTEQRFWLALIALSAFMGATALSAQKYAFGDMDVNGQNMGAIIAPGRVIILLSGACPAGYAETSSGRTLIGTTVAGGDVGTTGGADSITPTVSTLTAAAQTFTGSALGTHSHTAGTYSAAAQVFTGNAATLTGSVAAPVISWPAGVPTHSGTAATFAGNAATLTGTVAAPVFTGSALATHAHELPWQIPSTTTIRQIAIATFGTGTNRAATAVSAAGTANTTSAAVALSQAISAGTPAGTNSTPALTMNSYTPGGTVTISNQGAIAWPAGVPTNAAPALTINSYTPGGMNAASAVSGTSQAVSAGTAAGTNGTSAVTGTLNQFDNRSAWVKVILCVKL